MLIEKNVIEIQKYLRPTQRFQPKETRETRFWHLELLKNTLHNFSAGIQRTLSVFTTHMHFYLVNCRLLLNWATLGISSASNLFFGDNTLASEAKTGFFEFYGFQKGLVQLFSWNEKVFPQTVTTILHFEDFHILPLPYVRNSSSVGRMLSECTLKCPVA